MTGPRRWVCAALALAVGVAGAACGKKGAPMAPLVRIPAAVDKIAATRLGNDVYVTLTVPAANIDTSIPVDIDRIEVYGYTGRTPPTPARWAELATIVATIPVTPPPPVGEAAGPPALTPLLTPPPGAAGAVTGLPVTIRDTLTAEEFVQGNVAAIDPRRPAFVPLPVPGAVVSPVPTVLRRFYLAIPFSRRGRPGPPGAQAELVLTALPDPPAAVGVSYSAAATAITWEPSGGLLGFLLDRSLPPEPSPFLPTAPPPGTPAPVPIIEASVPPGPSTYHVYRDVAPDPLALRPAAPAPSWSVPLPLPLNVSPLAVTATLDEVAFGRERCYAVRAQRGSVLSEPSPRTCITPVDIFPPAAPVGLAAVPFEGGISLIWEPGADVDLGGYLVLRREPGDATLRQLTATPIGDARYRDTSVQPGTRYIYSVVAVDAKVPLPNVSAESERVEETAR